MGKNLKKPTKIRASKENISERKTRRRRKIEDKLLEKKKKKKKRQHDGSLNKNSNFLKE
jgi:hypothetical protein